MRRHVFELLPVTGLCGCRGMSFSLNSVVGRCKAFFGSLSGCVAAMSFSLNSVVGRCKAFFGSLSGCVAAATASLLQDPASQSQFT